MVILGVDPGLANTGWGVIQQDGSTMCCLGYGCITTTASEELPQRLARIHAELVDVIERFGVEACGLESVFFGSNARSAFATGQARGVAILALAERGISLGEYSPAEIKGAIVGVGRADKRQVSYMVRALLALHAEPQPDHAADALAVAICHAHTVRAAGLRKAASR